MKLINDKILRIIKKIGILLFWCIMLCAVLVSLIYVNRNLDAKEIEKVNIKILPENVQFFNRQKVLEEIRKTGLSRNIVGSTTDEINADNMELKLLSNRYIRNAKVYHDMKGNLNIKIEQREPLLRVYRFDNSSFYIDKTGIKVPLSMQFTSRVLVANGNIFERYKNHDSVYSYIGHQLYKIASYVDKHEFWKAQIEQIFVTRDNEFILIPKVGNHIILFGSAEEVDEKFEKLFVFYKEGLNRVGWNKYSSINIKYKGQVICKK